MAEKKGYSCIVFFTLLIGVISPFITADGAHLVHNNPLTRPAALRLLMFFCMANSGL